MYDRFVQKINLIKEKTAGMDQDDRHTAQLFLFIIMLVVNANAQKRMAERIIDEFFAPAQIAGVRGPRDNT